jgi:hypothetical protein
MWWGSYLRRSCRASRNVPTLSFWDCREAERRLLAASRRDWACLWICFSYASSACRDTRNWPCAIAMGDVEIVNPDVVEEFRLSQREIEDVLAVEKRSAGKNSRGAVHLGLQEFCTATGRARSETSQGCAAERRGKLPGYFDDSRRGREGLLDSNWPAVQAGKGVHAGDGTAIFLSRDFFGYCRLEAPVAGRVFVGNEFFARPLLPLIPTNDFCFVLALSQKYVRLFGGSRRGMQELHLQDTPKNIHEDLAGLSVERNHEMHTTAHPSPIRRPLSFTDRASATKVG